MKILLIDNYDSFTYNLVQYLAEIGAEVIVKRNDKITLEEIQKLSPQKIVISPGPCTPNESGICIDLVKDFAGQIPILGVCLGHQTIGVAFGAKLIQAAQIMHGKTSTIFHDGKKIYEGLPNPFKATRYHSLILEREGLPQDFVITAWTQDDIIMGIRHKKYALEGVQFHPESVLTTVGKQLLKNFIKWPSHELDFRSG